MKFIDLHQDLKLSLLQPELLSKEHVHNPQTNFEKLEANQVQVTLCTGFPMPEDRDFFKKDNFTALVEDIEWYTEYTRNNPNWMIVRSSADLIQCTQQQSYGIIFHLEGINMFTGETRDWEILNDLYDRGLRSVALTWSKSNPLAGGNDTPEESITTLGHELIAWALEHKLIVDLAHLSRAGFDDFAERYHTPLLVSHGAVADLRADDRNYTDEQLKKIGNSGGCFGLFFSKKFLTDKPDCSIEVVVAQLNHVRDVAGVDAVALGSDFGGIVNGTPTDLQSLDDLESLVEALKTNGWSDEECEKFAYRNAERVLQSYLA